MACCQPYRPLIPATLIRADTRDPRRSMNPLTGIWPACATVPGYRYVSPNGERHHPAAIVHCSLYIVHCSYTFSAKEKDVETGLSYFGSRYYSSDLSVWLSVDPMSDKYPSLSPYTYCADNPVKLVDPNGEEIDWVERTKYGRKEIYYDRRVKSQSDVDRIYGANSGVRHLADGTKVCNGQYSVYNDHEENKYGVVKDANGNIVGNHRNIIYGRGFVLFAGVTEESLDPSTLHNNLMKTSYTLIP